MQRSRLHQFTYRHSAFTNYTALSPQAHMLKAFVLVLSAQGGWSHGVLSTPNPRGCTPRGTGFDGLPYCSEFNGFGPNIVIGQQDGSETPSSTHACPHPGTRALMLCEHTQHKRPLSSKARRQRPTRSSATERLEVQTRPRSALARLLRSKPPLQRHTLAIGETPSPSLGLSLSLSLSPEPDPHPHLTSALYVSYDTDAVPDKEKRCGP